MAYGVLLPRAWQAVGFVWHSPAQAQFVGARFSGSLWGSAACSGHAPMSSLRAPTGTRKARTLIQTRGRRRPLMMAATVARTPMWMLAQT